MTKSWVDKFVARRAYAAGDELGKLTRKIGQHRIDRYAEVSGDRNSLHIDSAFAATTQFGGTIAHGMLLLGIFSYLLTSEFGQDWVDSGRMKIRFRAPARPGETLTYSGRVTKVDGTHIVCEIECRNESEVLISGEADVALP
jgi:3-hydroxybutyryl-CoA dehydratase